MANLFNVILPKINISRGKRGLRPQFWYPMECVECVTSCGGVVEVALWRCGICDVMWRYCGGVVVVVAVEMVLLLLLLWASV